MIFLPRGKISMLWNSLTPPEIQQVIFESEYYATLQAINEGEPWCRGFMSWKQPLAEIQGNAAYIRPKVVGSFPGPCTSESYMHQAAPFYRLKTLTDELSY
jgi:hypothetical protein